MEGIFWLLLYAAAAIAGLVLLGFFLYYAGRLVGLGVMRSIQDVLNERRT